MLELAEYAKVHTEYYKGVHPFEGLNDRQKETVIEGLILLRDANLLPPMQEDPEQFQTLMREIILAVQKDPELNSMQAINASPTHHQTLSNMTKEERIAATKLLLSRNPGLVDAVKRGVADQLYPEHGEYYEDDEELKITVKAGEHSSFDLKFEAEKRKEIENLAIRANMSVTEYVKHGIGEQLALEAALRQGDGRTPQSRQYVIDQFLLIKKMLRTAEPDGTITTSDPERVAMLHASLAEARIFEIPTSLFVKLNYETELFVCQEAGVEFTQPDERELPQEEIEVYMDTFRKLREDWSLPDQLPFEIMYFGLSYPVVMTADQRAAYQCPDDTDKATYLGYLVSADWAFVLVRTEHPEGPGCYALQEMRKGNWQHIDSPMLTSSPFIIRWLVEWINDHQTCVQESTRTFGYRRDYQKLCKRWRIKRAIPSPYYTVYLKDELIDEDAWLRKLRQRQSVRPRKSPEHQYDVRGAWVCRYLRGPKPLDKKLESKLRRDKRRKIFIDNPPDVETAIHMAKRGIAPKRKDEWLAILIYWRQDHRRGPETGPYVPSVRKSGRNKYRREETKVSNG